MIRLIFSCFILFMFVTYVSAGQLDDFSSDGCSQFPDGTISDQNLWCDCCFAHDIAYWQGGSRKQKKQADEALRTCVLEKTGNPILADSMYYGVTLGGSPVFLTWYRWGYGWRYGRGFQSLNTFEKQMVAKKLEKYRRSSANTNCDAEHPLKTKAIIEWKHLLDKLNE